jgi:hypothetical protein
MTDASDSRRSRRGVRTLAWFGAGAAVTLAASLLPAAVQTARPASPRVSVWVADRDASRIVGLDADLLPAREHALGWPLAVEPRDDGGLWVLRSGNATSGFGMRLASLDADGAVANETWLESAPDLALLDGSDALVIEHRGAALAKDRVWRFAPDGTGRILLEEPGLAALCAARGAVVLAARDGRLLRVAADASRKVHARTAHAASWADVAPGPDGGLFALDVSSPPAVAFLGPDLAVRWRVALGLAARSLGVVPGEERVWVSDSNGARVKRFGPGGALELDVPVVLHAPDHPVAWRGGGVLIGAPGAVLRLDAAGQPGPGQGGFAWISDLARAP